MTSGDTGADRTLVFRPQRLLFWCVVFAGLIVISSLAVWIGLGSQVRAMFTGLQIGTLLLFIGFSIALIMALGLCEVRASADGLWWRNGIRSHRLAWSEVRSIRFRPGDPWMFVYAPGADGDDERHQVMGIQSTDGARARAHAEEVRAMWRRHARPGGADQDSALS